MKSSIQFTARCECGDITITNRRIANYWSHKKCDKCEKKLCVFKDDQLIYDYNNIIFTASCNCNMLCFKNKLIPTYWSQMKCSRCFSKLIIKDPKNNVVHNYQSRLKLIKAKQISVTIDEEIKINSPIKNDIFMGYSPFEQFPSQTLTNEEIDNALDIILNDNTMNFSFFNEIST
jgi:hypothetical protein